MGWVPVCTGIYVKKIKLCLDAQIILRYSFCVLGCERKTLRGTLPRESNNNPLNWRRNQADPYFSG